MSDVSSSPAAERLRLALDLFAAGEEMMRQKLRREDPDATDKEIETRLVAWLHECPGADVGDAALRVGPWPRQR